MPEKSIPFYVDQLMTLYSEPRITAPLVVARDHESCDPTRDGVGNNAVVSTVNNIASTVCTPSISQTPGKVVVTSSSAAVVSVCTPSTSTKAPRMKFERL